jgi:hypothetical protein
MRNALHREKSSSKLSEKERIKKPAAAERPRAFADETLGQLGVYLPREPLILLAVSQGAARYFAVIYKSKCRLHDHRPNGREGRNLL